METTSRKTLKCCVIGGGGFLGSHIVDELLRQGHAVNVFDMHIPEAKMGVTAFKGNLCVLKDLLPALEDVSVVFHTASPNPLSNNRSLFYKVNYEGTKVIIQACKQSKVKKFVLTSSASVVLEGKDLKNGTEEMPYAKNFVDYYTESKIMQEKLVLEANSDDFLTCAIRPHGIFGPNDVHNVPTMVKMAKKGSTKFIIGNGKNIVDFTYVDNVVHGHILAAEKLSQGSPVCGQAFNITNDEPVRFWGYISSILVGLNYPAPKCHLPYTFLYIVAMVMHFLSMLLRPVVTITPTLTPHKVIIAGTHHYFSCEKAKHLLGYKPIVSYEDGVRKTIESFHHLRNNT